MQRYWNRRLSKRDWDRESCYDHVRLQANATDGPLLTGVGGGAVVNVAIRNRFASGNGNGIAVSGEEAFLRVQLGMNGVAEPAGASEKLFNSHLVQFSSSPTLPFRIYWGKVR